MAVQNIVALVKVYSVLHNFTWDMNVAAAGSRDKGSEGMDEAGGDLQSIHDVKGRACDCLNRAAINACNTFADSLK
jgi:hypothetical protein